jgi:ketosteroid isomerase-like protein
MADLSTDEINAIANPFFAAIEAGDVEAVKRAYAADAAIWHNFDNKEQRPEDNATTLAFLHSRAQNLKYTEIRRFASPDGFVQQHVLVGDTKAGPLKMPAIIRFYVSNGLITRLEEYLDLRQATVLNK